MDVEPTFFVLPCSEPLQLAVSPRLASWMAADHPDQQRLSTYLAHAEDVLAPQLAAMQGALALRLDVGLPPGLDLLDQRDLDNYAYPLARRVSAAEGVDLVSVWATKAQAERSTVRVATAAPWVTRPPADRSVTVRTTASA